MEDLLILIPILALLLFIFLTIGLFHGIKLKDDIGAITDKIKSYKKIHPLDIHTGGPDFEASGIGELIVGLLLWLVVSFILAYLFWITGAILWILFLLIAASLYWIFFRALRLVFLKSRICRGNLIKSAAYGFLYTFLYTSWIYAIIYTVQYLKGSH
ncbi:MAG: hypothetical protein IPL53_09375 [Ignavibacteria bacterium]|nr:hypothetical protein [Ignavibacteria bacterium]